MSKVISCKYDIRNPQLWELTRNFKRQDITVPKGFAWDGASVPNLIQSIIPRWGMYSSAVLVHDYLYDKSCKIIISRKDTDNLFYSQLIEDNVNKLQSFAMYLGVRLFGKSKFRR